MFMPGIAETARRVYYAKCQHAVATRDVPALTELLSGGIKRRAAEAARIARLTIGLDETDARKVYLEGLRIGRKCGRCGHDMSGMDCGQAQANDVYLCHTDDHSCYNLVTRGF